MGGWRGGGAKGWREKGKGVGGRKGRKWEGEREGSGREEANNLLVYTVHLDCNQSTR